MAKWEKIASDYGSNFWKNYLFVKGAALQPNLVAMPQVYLAIRGYPKEIDYLYLPKTWKEGHERLSQLADQNITFVEKILEKSRNHGIEMNKYTEKFVRDDLTKYSNNKILEAYRKHAELNSLEYAWGIMIPVLDFQDAHYFEDKLKAILKKNLSKSELGRAFAVFTQPLKDSFALEQEKSILKIFQNFPRYLLKEKPDTILQKLRKNYPGTYRRLKQHTNKYAWVFYVYSGPAATEKDFIETLKFYAKKKINPEKKLRQMADETRKVLFERKKYFRKMKLDARERRYVELAAEVIYLKPRRKDYQSKSYYHLEFLQREIGRRIHLSLSQVRSCTFEEIKTALNGGKTDVHAINERMKFHIVIPDGEKVKIYSEKAAQKYEKNIKKEKIEINQSEKISGQTAYPGKAEGKVRKIDSPEEIGKMKEGDILVSSATAPNILPAIRLAAAIVTDEGGLTAHAAIVSREFKIPCVVGTKFATKILRDGDLVEVDAGKGTVKIIKKASK
jgi:phosphohistidine swiveling domain-containing protein